MPIFWIKGCNSSRAATERHLMDYVAIGNCGGRLMGKPASQFRGNDGGSNPIETEFLPGQTWTSLVWYFDAISSSQIR
jgi:hypothetical protein